MRVWLAVGALVAASSSCGEGLNRDEGAGGGSVCDGKSECSECVSCANANPCRDSLERCQGDSSCQSVRECIEVVCGGDVQCENECRANNPSGAQLYDATLDCIYCVECPSDCAGFRVCD